MKKNSRLQRLLALALFFAGAAHAQQTNFGLSAGLKAWNTQWTTWGYDNNGTIITQSPAKDKTVFIPLASARYREFVASVSGFRGTTFELLDGSTNRRNEFDLNVGWLFTPGVAATVGYKRVGQKAGDFDYQLGGPTVGLSATAPLQGAFSLYGTLGLGRMKKAGGNVDFDADYQLSEVGLAYNLGLGGIPRGLTFTLGYRIQVLNSKDALPGQDARDLTQGFAFGLLAVF